MSKSLTLSKMSLKDIVIAVLVLYITYKLAYPHGIEPCLHSVTMVQLTTYYQRYKLSGKYRIRTDKQGSVSFKLAHIPIYQCPCFTIRLTSLINQWMVRESNPSFPCVRYVTDYLEYYHPYKNEQFNDMLRSRTTIQIVYGHIQVGIKDIQPALTQRTRV